MDKIIKRATNLYVQGFLTKDEMASLIAKEYAKLWARGKILKLVNR